MRAGAPGSAGDALLFTRNGKPWGKSCQRLPAAAGLRARQDRAGDRIPRPAPYLGVAGGDVSGLPLMIVARNLGHTDHQDGRGALRAPGAVL